MKKKWSKQRVISELKRRCANGEPLHERHILNYANPLRCAAKKLFGSYREALLASGLDPVTITGKAWQSSVDERKKWSRSAIVSLLHERYKAGKQIHRSAMVRDGYGSMCVAVPREFGSYEAAIRAAGIEYSEIRGDRKFEDWFGDPNRVLEKIRELAEMGYELNHSSVHGHDKALCWAARKYFGSWYGAVARAGFDAESVRRDRNREADKGNVFENICFEIFKQLRPGWQKGAAIYCGSYTSYPDLYDPTTEEWIDFKLRAYGESTDLSIQKYKPFAKALRIIYLLGHRYSQDDVIFQSIYDYEQEVSGADLKYCFDDLRQLRSYGPPPIHLEKWALKWTRQSIADWIVKQPTETLYERNVLLEWNDIRCAARRLFGSWRAAVAAAGVDPGSVRKQRARIEKHELDGFIRTRFERGQRLNPRYICDHFGGEYNSAIRIYGGWRQAVIFNGIPYEEVINRKWAKKRRRS
jgi:hypothetical protein